MDHPYHTILRSLRSFILSRITTHILSAIMSNLNLDENDENDLREKTETVIDVLLNVRPIAKFVDAILSVQPANDISDTFQSLKTDYDMEHSVCYGCFVDHPSQIQHMGLGGCLSQEDDDS